MTKRQTRWFFLLGTLVFTLVFIGMTIDSHRQFGELTNADQLTEEVVHGQHVWHANNCINCHTLLGEGAYYAPDLTKITDHRGEAYLTAFLKDPSRFYSEEEHRRLMPNPNLSDDEIAHVIAFLEWVSNIDNQGWPPRPIRVTGSLQGAYSDGSTQTVASDEPSAVGRGLFNASPPGCVACHSTSPGVVLAGPSMAELSSRAEQIIASDTYQGNATTAEEFIRESIVDPSIYISDVDRYAAGDSSLMPANYQATLESEQIDALVAYLTTLR